MSLTALHVATVFLVALVMGTTLAHALEMPAKMRVSGSFWVECQHTLYRFFRYIAGPIEVAAVLISAVLAFFTFGLATSGASLVTSILLMVAFIVWGVVTERVNRQSPSGLLRTSRRIGSDGARSGSIRIWSDSSSTSLLSPRRSSQPSSTYNKSNPLRCQTAECERCRVAHLDSYSLKVRQRTPTRPA